MNLRKLFINSLIILLLITLLASTINREALAEEASYPSTAYGFRVNLTGIGITPKYVNVIDRSRVVIVGSLGKVYGVIVLNVLNPYEDPVVEDMYPLTGAPTYVATDGYPATRLAVGSDKGEILLLRINAGRITRHLYVVLGADFYVNKLVLAKDVFGVKVISLVSEGGPRGYPCMNCHVYVLDEESKGVLRIGPRVGNASTTCPGLERVNVQDVVPLAIYGSSGYYWDSSNVAVTYIPPVVKLVFNVTYANITTGEFTPLRGALVEVSLMYNETGSMLVYGVNVDADGLARVPVPFEKTSALLVNLTIRDISGMEIWKYRYVFDPRNLTEMPDEILLPAAVLSTMSVDSRPATKIYGVPPFLNVALDLVDLTLAPNKCDRKAVASFYVKPSVRDLAIMQGEEDSRLKIVYTEPDEGFLTVTVATINGTRIEQITHVTDYVGVNAVIAASGTFSDGGYLITGLSDGRLRMYVAQSESYKLKDIYTMGSPLYDLLMIPSVEGYTYVAVSSSGVQVLRVEPYPMPVYRNLASLYLSTPGFLHGDALADLSTIVLIDAQGLTIIRNTDIAVANKLALTADKVMARNVELVVNMPGGEEAYGTIIVLNYPDGSSNYTLKGNSITLRNMLPSVNYTVNIYPAKTYIYNATIKFTIREDLSLEILESSYATVSIDNAYSRIIVNTTYRAYELRIRVQDEYTGLNLVAPLDIYIDNKTIATESRANEYTVKLVYGDHSVIIQPSSGFENAYQSYATTLTINEDTDVIAIMERVKHPVSIRVMDNYGTIISPVELNILGLVKINKTIEQPGTVTTLLPYGDYTLTITPTNTSIYVPYEATLTVKSPQTLNIVIQRVKYKVEVSVSSKLGIIGKFDLYANGTKVASNIEKQAVVELPYGLYTLRLVPAAGYEDVYEPSGLISLSVTSDTSVSIPVNRKTYALKVVTLEQGRPIVNVAIHVYSVETGELITAMTTDQNGAAQLSLPYGIYRLEMTHDQYSKEVRVIPLNREISEVVSMTPTPLTLLWRFMPIIGALIGVGIALYVAMKIRAIIAKRLVTEESF